MRLRNLRRLTPALLLLALATPHPAHAVNRDMVQLQTQVQQLIDALARLQQSNDQQMGVLKDLVQQDVDAVNKMSTTVAAMQLKMQNGNDAQAQRNDQLSGQVQALNDSLDELKARMQRMEKTLTDLQSQAQSNAAILNNMPAATGAAPASGAAPAPTNAQPAAPANPGPGDAVSTPPTGAPGGLATAPAPIANGGAPAGPPANAMYRAAYSDYMAGKYNLAASEFGDLVKAYPDENLSGNALFYTGEIERRNNKPTAAIKDYDQVLERYPDNQKIPAAHLHKGEILLAQKDTEAGVRELRALIQRFPQSPEASQAKARLSALGAPSSARR